MLSKTLLQMGVSAMTLLLHFEVLALSSTGEITGFKMQSCGKSKCIGVSALKVSEGILVGNYFSNNAKFSIKDKVSNKNVVELETNSFYYDNLHNFIYIKDVIGENAQYSYEISTETLQRYPLKQIPQ